MNEKQARGPEAFLALFAPPGCAQLAHKPCGQRCCPCDDARAWLRSLPDSLSPKAIWGRVRRTDWLRWLADHFGVGELARGKSCREIRLALPWERMAEAIANPPTQVKCESCGDATDFDELRDGRCDECDGEYEYCSVCDDRHHGDSFCDHLEWSTRGGYVVGTGADEGKDPESFDRALGKLGRKLTKVLRADLVKGVVGMWEGDSTLDERLKHLREKARDTDDRDGTEAGLIWLNTLPSRKDHPAEHKALTKQTLSWLDAHLAAREQAILADPRPRRLIRDGAGRWWIDGSWTAVREQGRWLHRAEARALRDQLCQVYPRAGIKMVHVLTPAPQATKEGSR